MQVWFTRHATQRYIERLRPALDAGEATRELRCLSRAMDVSPEPPEWVLSDHAAHGYLVLGDACFPLKRNGKGFVALTCLTRGTIPDRVRQARNQRHRQERKARREARQANRWYRMHPGPRPIPTVGDEAA